MEVIEITEREIEIIEVIERGPVGQIGPQANINYTVVSSSQTVSSRQLIAADTSGGSFTLTLPLNPAAGDAVDIFDYSETFDTNPLTIARNGQPIESLPNDDLICNVEGAYFTLIFTGGTRGWQVLPRYGTSGGAGESTLTTQGDMLYRGAGINTRLPIGSAGQILKVNSVATAPEWGAAPATGVTSVGITGSDGIEVDSGSPVTGSGSIALGVNAASLRSHINVADGANNYTHPNHTGEVTSSGDGATTIANDAVTNAKLANMAQSTLKGRATASTGDPEDLSASQVRTILNVADGAEVNVQSNWTEADSGSDAFILNKPSLATVATTGDYDDLTDKPTLGNSASLDVGTTTGTVAAGDDARLSDDRDPNAHAASHASGGSDPIAPSDIGAQDKFVAASQVLSSSSTTLTAGRARRIELATTNSGDTEVVLPTSSNQQDDLIQLIRAGSIAAGRIFVVNSAGGSELASLGTTADAGRSFTFRYQIGANAWVLVPIDAHGADKIISGTLTHERGGLEADVSAYNGLVKISGGSTSAVGIGTGSTEVAAGDHTHELDELDATGATNGHVLTADGSNGASWQAASGGVTAVGASAADILSVSGSDIVADDANADRIVYWNNTSNKLAYGTVSDVGAAAASHTHAASDVTSGTFDNARINFAAPPAIGNTTPNTGAFTTLTANNGTLTASAPVLDLSQTWNASGTTFTALRVNATNTASNAASMLMDLQTGGTSQFSVDRAGVCTVVGLRAANSSNPVFIGSAAGFTNATASIGSGAIRIVTTAHYGWTPSGNMLDPADLQLHRDAADTLAQRRDANAQTFRIYNTFTSATNHERGFLRWSSNVFQIGTEKGSGGGTARALEIRTDDVTRINVSATGGLGFFGATAAAQPAAIADATDAASTQARLNDLLAAVRSLGLIAT